MGIFINVHFILPTLWLFLLVTTTKSYAQIAETPYSPPPPYYKMKQSPFKPSIAVVVGILTTIFSITFLLLLYAKHCKKGPFSTTTTTTTATTTVPPPSTLRKNSGIDRTIIESLPVFRFGSLRGQKAEGLECAVCLNKFEPTEILRLLPKCKHAFHVECVDTWLDAHSTCPLCRYKVDPEDILLVSSVHDHGHNNNNNGSLVDQRKSCSNNSTSSALVSVSSSPVKSRERIFSSGRHSSAGERGSSSLQIIVETPKEEKKARMSLDGWNLYKKKCKSSNLILGQSVVQSITRSSSSILSTRKDAMLLYNGNKEVAEVAEDTAEKRRLEHRIIISGNETAEGSMSESGTQYRWSDVEACDMLYLRSEMILSDSRRYSGSRRWTGEIESSRNCNGSGRRVTINERSVSEMTGMSRFKSNEEERERQRQRKGAVTRWLDWISQSQSLPAAASTSSTSAT